MTPLMHLEGDKIVEDSLLGPADDGPRMSPTLAEEAVLLGDKPEPQDAQEAAVLPWEHPQETPEPKDTVKQSDVPCQPPPSAMA